MDPATVNRAIEELVRAFEDLEMLQGWNRSRLENNELYLAAPDRIDASISCRPPIPTNPMP